MIVYSSSRVSFKGREVLANSMASETEDAHLKWMQAAMDMVTHSNFILKRS